MAFKIAGSLALKEALKEADHYILEPMMKIEITVPEDYLGEVMASVTSRRGNILGNEMRNGVMIVRGSAPLSELFGYATTLRSLTQGRGTFSMEFESYCEIPKSVRERLLGNKY